MYLTTFINHRLIAFLRNCMLSCICLIGLTGTVFAQDASDALLALQILEVQEKTLTASDFLYFGYGYELRETSDIGFLNPQDHAHLQKTFVRGNSYAIAAVGSSLADIDIYLYDLVGNLIVYDNLATEDAVITFDVTRTGVFNLVVENSSRDFVTPVSILYGFKN